MKKMKKSLAVLTILFFSMIISPTSVVKAKSSNLKIDTVYNTTKTVKGKINRKQKKYYKVKLKIGKKTYTVKTSKRGRFTLKIKKQKPGTKLKVIVYRKNKLKQQKQIYVIAKNPVVNRFSLNSKKISGYTRKNYLIIAKINGKTYKSKSNNTSGKFTINSKKKIGENTVNIKIYKQNHKNKKLVKEFNKKAYDIKKKKEDQKPIEIPPDKENPIDLSLLKKDLERSAIEKKHISRFANKEGFYKNDYMWFVDYRNYDDKNATWISIGNISYFLDLDANGDMASFTAKNGITIYGCVGTGNIGNVKQPTRDEYDFKLESGETKTFVGSDFEEIPDSNLFYKILGYKNGKLIMMQNESLYLLTDM